MSDLSDSLLTALRSAPELTSSPALAVGVASDSTVDPALAGQATAHAANSYAQDQAVDNTGKVVGHPNLLHQTLGWLGGAAHAVNDMTSGLAGKAVHGLGVPLRDIQHQYRYLHDVEARHGPVAALLEGLGIAAGATAGAFLTENAQGGVAGGELMSTLQSRLFYRDSFDRTTSGAQYQPYYNRQTGEYSGTPGTVSAGRDITRALGLKPGSKPFTFISGAGDALFDLELDPLIVGGKLSAAARGEEGLQGAKLGLADRYPGTRFVTPNDVDRGLAAYPSIKRGMQQLADMSTAELTSDKKWAPFASQLGPAKTVDEVAQVFKDHLDIARTVSSSLPTSSLVGGAAKAASTAVQNYEGLGSGVIKSVTSFVPSTFDVNTLKLSGKEFDPASDHAVRGVYQVARYSMTKRAAEGLAGEFADASPGDRIGIYRNILVKMFAARGLEADAPEVKHELEQLMGGSAPGFDAKYGTDALARDISRLPDDGVNKEVSAAIGFNQTGKLAYPDFNRVTRMTRELSEFKSLYGAADDFIYKDFTQRIFKRLALLSGGFAQRIAMAEAIPAAAREGFTNLVKNQLATTAGKLGYDLAHDNPDELGRVAGLVWHLGKGADRVAGGAGKLLTNPETVNDLTDMVYSLNGHRLPAAVDTTTHYSGEVGGTAVAKERGIKSAWAEVPKGKQFGDKFMSFGNDDLQFDQAWAQKLSTVSQEPLHREAASLYLDAIAHGADTATAVDKGAAAVTDLLHSTDPKKLSLYQRATRPSVIGADPLEDWGRVVMADLKGVTHSPDTADAAGIITSHGTPHTTLLENIANGKQTDMDLLSSIDDTLKPLKVEGRELIDIPHQHLLERITNFGFSRVLDPIINKLSREPIYANEWLKQYQPFKPLVDSGALDKGDAIQLAHTRAVQNMVPFIHNTLERSQFAELSRNFMPFFFAQQQALARYGRVLADNPGAFRQLQLMTASLHDTAAEQKDPNGNSWLVYPGLGFLTNATIGALGAAGLPTAGSVPVSYSGRVTSLSSVFPLGDVAPKFGPVVAIAGHALENLFPELREPVTSVIGDAGNSGSIWSQLIPNSTLKGLVVALGDDHRRAFASAAMQTLQSLAYQQNVAVRKWEDGGEVGAKPQIVPDAANNDPKVRQPFIDRVKNQTRILLTVKALLASVTPTAISPNIGDMGLRKEFQAAIAKDGFAKGVQQFMFTHPDASPLTVMQSDSPLGSGAVLPSKAAEDYYNTNEAYLKQFPYAGVWLVPQVADKTFNSSVYNEQLAQGLRVKRSPEEFFTQLQVASGDQQFFGTSDVDYGSRVKALKAGNASPAAFAQLAAQAKVDPRVGDYYLYQTALAKATATGDDTTALRQRWSDHLAQLQRTAPLWFDDFTSNDRANKRQLTAEQLVDMFKNGNVPPGPQTADLRDLVTQYQRYQNAILVGRQDSYAAMAKSELTHRWQTYVTTLAAEKPNLAPVINHVFRSL